MTSVGASARNAVAVVSACMDGVRVGARSVVAGARYVSTESENVSVKSADTNILLQKMCNYHLFARILANRFLQISKKRCNCPLFARRYHL